MDLQKATLFSLHLTVFPYKCICRVSFSELELPGASVITFILNASKAVFRRFWLNAVKAQRNSTNTCTQTYPTSRHPLHYITSITLQLQASCEKSCAEINDAFLENIPGKQDRTAFPPVSFSSGVLSRLLPFCDGNACAAQGLMSCGRKGCTWHTSSGLPHRKGREWEAAEPKRQRKQGRPAFARLLPLATGRKRKRMGCSGWGWSTAAGNRLNH